MIDEMSIMKHVDYNHSSQTSTGYVDVGKGGDSTELAKHVLVFMLVGVMGFWKLPIAFFL